MANQIIRFKCDYCRKHFSSKSYAEKVHERTCIYNPVRKSCLTCVSFYQDVPYTEPKCINKYDISKKLKVNCNGHEILEDE